MSEMRGVDTTKLENEQAQTTQGLAVTTASIRQMDGTISSGNQGTHSRLDAITRVLSIESPDEKQAREQAAAAARAAEARFDELIRLQESGNATDEQVLDAQRAMEEAQREENERSERRSMFDRLSDRDDGSPDPDRTRGSGSGGDDEPGFFEKTFGKFFKLIKGVVGVLLAVAIPALAFLLNSPVFEKLKEALFNFIDYIFETVVPFIQKEVIPRIKEFYEKFIIPIKDFIMNFLFMEGGGIDIILDTISKQWENVKSLFSSMLDLFDNLMSGNFEKAFGNLGDIGSTLMDAIDEGLTAILKLGLAAFGLTFDGTIGDVISNWLTSTWESIKAAMRAIIPDMFEPEFLQAGSADQRKETMAAAEAIKEAEGQEKKAQRDLRGAREAAREEARSGQVVEARRRQLAELEAKAEEQGGFDKLEQSKLFGLSKNDIIEARELLAKAEERQRKAAEKTAELYKQIEASQGPSLAERAAEADRSLRDLPRGYIGDVQVGSPEDRAIRRILAKLSAGQLTQAEAAEQVNQAANNNKASSVVIQQNDNSQQSSTEQKTVVEQNKELSGTGSAAALARAVETAL